MPARKTPSAGGKPDKIFRDALMIAVRRIEEDDEKKKSPIINQIATKLARRARTDTTAAQIVRDTLDGRPAQALTIGNDPETGPLVVRWET